MKYLISTVIILFFISTKLFSQIAKDSLAEKNSSSFEKSKQEAYKKIEAYRQRVIKGESMSDLAALYSEDPGSAKFGGRINNIERGRMVSEFEDVAFSLKEGEISEVFETRFGYHFIQLISAHGEAVDLRHLLVKYSFK